ncbi:MAG: class A beta-lactamase-related serine hydrolase [Chitinophagaceae bacterium]|nr:MAG: class A beta-lactamase-related serine hydrolase [Chitinophagaceae bacterium]
MGWTGRVVLQIMYCRGIKEMEFLPGQNQPHKTHTVMKKFHYLVYFLMIALVSGSCKKENNKEGEEPVVQTDIAAIDAKVQAFMTTYAAPGASLAISHNGKLVYRKGYGLADKTSGEKVTTDHRFRIASVSKTFTAIAIMKLVQDGKLSLSQKVFGTGSLLGTAYGAAPYSFNVASVTVRDLLRHTSGGWNNSYPGDICFTNPAMTADQLTDWALKNKPLSNTPGTTYQYSNFGYLVLARIIEKVTAKTYAAYMKESILQPLGITHTEIMGNTLADRKSGEVVYYGQGSEAANVYSDPYARNDGPMGWISTPTEMLMLFTAADSSATRPDILTASTLTAMRTPSAANQYVACGLVVENDAAAGGSIWYHFGSLPGTQSVMFRMTNGWCASFVINTRAGNGNTSQNAFAEMLLGIVADNTIAWQDIDQFPPR